MKTPKGQINRTGVVSFGDASLAVWEDGIRDAREAGGYAGESAWQLAFKRQVFARIVQTLHRIGWTVGPRDRANHNKAIAQNHRTCRKGDLQAELSVSGRRINFEMWQGVNTPTRPDHGGRYESDKEGCMPYVLRLEMERTRRRIRDYLCNVFSGYTFDPKHRSIYRKPLQHTAWEIVQQHYAKSIHFKGVDFEDYKYRNYGLPGNLKSADGVELTHLQKVFFTDSKGRWLTGTALYNINNMWWVIYDTYSYTNVACFDLHAKPPANLRAKANGRQRRQRLNGLLADAVKAMDFDRAKLLKGILWPEPEPLFHILKNGAYFRPNYCGYTSNPVDAGKYTRAELRPYADQIERGDLQAVPVAA